jgi:transposase
MSDTTLFGKDDGVCERGSTRGPVAAGAPRLITAERRQVTLQPCDLESLLAPEHRARAIWSVVERLDLARFYDAIRARAAEPGRPATDPKVLVALWVYATCDGVGSARELARRCEEADAYRWLRGGVPVNHHTLSDFRTGHGAALDELLTQVVAALLKAGLLSLKRVAQDGLRVRASAGASSFRRRQRLVQCLEAARAHVAALKATGDAEAAAQRTRERAAQERAAREREARVTQALAQLAKVEALRAR